MANETEDPFTAELQRTVTQQAHIIGSLKKRLEVMERREGRGVRFGATFLDEDDVGVLLISIDRYADIVKKTIKPLELAGASTDEVVDLAKRAAGLKKLLSRADAPGEPQPRRRSPNEDEMEDAGDEEGELEDRVPAGAAEEMRELMEAGDGSLQEMAEPQAGVGPSGEELAEELAAYYGPESTYAAPADYLNTLGQSERTDIAEWIVSLSEEDDSEVLPTPRAILDFVTGGPVWVGRFGIEEAPDLAEWVIDVNHQFFVARENAFLGSYESEHDAIDQARVLNGRRAALGSLIAGSEEEPFSDLDSALDADTGGAQGEEARELVTPGALKAMLAEQGIAVRGVDIAAWPPAAIAAATAFCMGFDFNSDDLPQTVVDQAAAPALSVEAADEIEAEENPAEGDPWDQGPLYDAEALGRAEGSIVDELGDFAAAALHLTLTDELRRALELVAGWNDYKAWCFSAGKRARLDHYTALAKILKLDAAPPAEGEGRFRVQGQRKPVSIIDTETGEVVPGAENLSVSEAKAKAAQWNANPPAPEPEPEPVEAPEPEPAGPRFVVRPQGSGGFYQVVDTVNNSVRATKHNEQAAMERAAELNGDVPPVGRTETRGTVPADLSTAPEDVVPPAPDVDVEEQPVAGEEVVGLTDDQLVIRAALTLKKGAVDRWYGYAQSGVASENVLVKLIADELGDEQVKGNVYDGERHVGNYAARGGVHPQIAWKLSEGGSPTVLRALDLAAAVRPIFGIDSEPAQRRIKPGDICDECFSDLVAGVCPDESCARFGLSAS